MSLSICFTAHFFKGGYGGENSGSLWSYYLLYDSFRLFLKIVGLARVKYIEFAMTHNISFYYSE